jgi:hypothetical protein
VILASQAKDPGQGSSYRFCMAALAQVEFLATSFALGAGSFVCTSSFVPRSMRSSGLLFLTPRHKNTLVVGHRILGFLYGAAVWYSTKTLAHR